MQPGRRRGPPRRHEKPASEIGSQRGHRALVAGCITRVDQQALPIPPVHRDAEAPRIADIHHTRDHDEHRGVRDGRVHFLDQCSRRVEHADVARLAVQYVDPVVFAGHGTRPRHAAGLQHRLREGGHHVTRHGELVHAARLDIDDIEVPRLVGRERHGAFKAGQDADHRHGLGIEHLDPVVSGVRDVEDAPVSGNQQSRRLVELRGRLPHAADAWRGLPSPEHPFTR
jgi:hypothetical protein